MTSSASRFVIATIVACCSVVTAAIGQAVLTNQFPSLTFSSPVGVVNPGDGTDRLFVVEQTGKIKVFVNSPSTTTSKVFLNIQDSVSGVGGSGEMGLLGIAFHPQYASNGYFYLNYTMTGPMRTRISRFQVSGSNPDSAVRTSELVLIEQPQPYDNHKGGQLAFGPDGYLYIGFGDGGSGGDPENRSQNDTTFLGKMLRINVDASAGGKNYAIPSDNPFVDSVGKKKEIYAKGFRNPWRFAFDQSTLWVGDVGQGAWEEIDTVQKGKNYGWRIMEGYHCFNPSSGCNQTGLTLPIWEYDHTGRCSITGGFVYRGSNIPQLYGRYIYTDFCSMEVWALDARGPGAATNALIATAINNVSSFGTDKFGELYACLIYSGKIYKLALSPPGATTLISPANAQTGVSKTPILLWKSTANAATYRLQVSTDSTFVTTTFDDSTLTDTSKQIGPLGNLTKYYWRVRGKNSSGNGAYATKRNFTTLDDTFPPATPVLLTPTNDTVNRPLSETLRWLTSSGAVTYRVQFGTDSTFGAVMIDDSTLIDTSKGTGSLSYLTKYFWRVRAKNSAGLSAFSSVWRFTTMPTPPPPPTPVLLAPADGAGNESVNTPLLWGKASGATSYRVQVALDAAFSSVEVDDSTITDTTSATPTLPLATLHYWRVRAKNAYGISAFSAYRTFTTALYSASYHIQKGWNLVSIPVTVIDGKKNVLFPTAISHSYKYVAGSSYIISDSMIPGVGYWIKFADSQHVVISGAPIAVDTVDISLGWNMIGTTTNTVPLDSVEQLPPGISNGTFFGYTTSYFQASGLQPSRGYWLKATSTGKLIIRSGGAFQFITGEQEVLRRPSGME